LIDFKIISFSRQVLDDRRHHEKFEIKLLQALSLISFAEISNSGRLHSFTLLNYLTTKFESDLLNSFVSVLMEADIVPVVVQGPDHPGVPHEGLVVPDELHGVVELPAVAAVVLEARQVPAEVGSLLQQTDGTEGVLQVRIHLDLLGEL